MVTLGDKVVSVNLENGLLEVNELIAKRDNLGLYAALQIKES